MAARWLPSNAEPPSYPDECADCGVFMLSKMIGSDGKARCVACDSARKRSGV